MNRLNENTEIGQDFERTLVDGSADELNELKSWLFRENIRLSSEKNELRRLEEKFLAEKQKFRSEMEEVNRRFVTERKRLKQDELFFDKKMDILKNGFMQLDEERKQFEKEKMNFTAQKHAHETVRKQEMGLDTAKLLFQGVKSQLALKKRYRDLLKMFHPDNIAGDHEMVLLINAVYEELRKDYEFGRRA